eukprot:1217270-Rhodomonas_salina.1
MRYARSRTEIAYDTTVCYYAMLLPTSYVIYGTDIAYGATRRNWRGQGRREGSGREEEEGEGEREEGEREEEEREGEREREEGKKVWCSP